MYWTETMWLEESTVVFFMMAWIPFSLVSRANLLRATGVSETFSGGGEKEIVLKVLDD